MSREDDTHASLVHSTLLVCGMVLAIAGVVGLLFVARNVPPLIFGAILIAVVLNRLATKSSDDSWCRLLYRAIVGGSVTGQVSPLPIDST